MPDQTEIIIRDVRADSAHAAELITELDDILIPLYPPESHHGYTVEKLLGEGVLFYIVWVDGAAAGCGGVQMYTGYGEVKRMYVRPAYRGAGLGKLMLNHLQQTARSRGVSLLRLETGILQTEAIGLYERFGFLRRGPFGEYVDDPLSVFFEMPI